MRTLLERISRGRAFTRRLPAQFGALPIIVSPDAQLKYLKPGYEAFDAGLLRAAAALVKAGDNVWDVGANVGVFTMAAAALSRTGQILAIEADIWLAGLIRRTSQLPANAIFNISVLPAAAFSSAGVAKFSIAARGRASNHLTSVSGNSETGGSRETVDVTTLPLDALLAHYAPPNIIKIDVEGAEVEVLKGAEDILKTIRPLLYCEVNKDNQEEFLKILSKFDYSPRSFITKKATDIGFNMIYVPEEKQFLPLSDQVAI